MSTTTKSAVSHKKLVLFAGLGLAMTVATGVVYGRLSQRWGPVPDLVAAGAKLREFPTQIGDWQLLKEETMRQSIVDILQCTGYVHRQYVNRSTGKLVSLAITVGPSGPISVHTPEICYSSRSYSIEEQRTPVVITDKNGTAHSFWKLSFRSNSTTADSLRVYYAWSADDRWESAESPRFEFAARPILYKLQISSLVAPDGTEGTNDPCNSFLADLLQTGWTTGT
jgi:hypothetical protein